MVFLAIQWVYGFRFEHTLPSIPEQSTLTSTEHGVAHIVHLLQSHGG